jgi:hypothetical protein
MSGASSGPWGGLFAIAGLTLFLKAVGKGLPAVTSIATEELYLRGNDAVLLLELAGGGPRRSDRASRQGKPSSSKSNPSTPTRRPSRRTRRERGGRLPL